MQEINRQLCDIESEWHIAPPARGAPVHRYFRHSARPLRSCRDRYARAPTPATSHLAGAGAAAPRLAPPTPRTSHRTYTPIDNTDEQMTPPNKVCA